jgi:hypothetical protein
MNYENAAKDLFEQIVASVDELKNNPGINHIQVARLCILCGKFEEYFNRWRVCANNINGNELAKLKAYEVYIQSTPINKLLDVPYNKRFNWLATKFTKRWRKAPDFRHGDISH